jgi:hypothetical protein
LNETKVSSRSKDAKVKFKEEAKQQAEHDLEGESEQMPAPSDLKSVKSKKTNKTQISKKSIISKKATTRGSA